MSIQIVTRKEKLDTTVSNLQEKQVFGGSVVHTTIMLFGKW